MSLAPIGSPAVAVHEMSHFIEDRNPDILAKSVEYRNQRIASGNPFYIDYCSSARRGDASSEILSVGMEGVMFPGNRHNWEEVDLRMGGGATHAPRLPRDQVRYRGDLTEKDPGLCHYVLGVLAAHQILK